MVAGKEPGAEDLAAGGEGEGDEGVALGRQVGLDAHPVAVAQLHDHVVLLGVDPLLPRQLGHLPLIGERGRRGDPLDRPALLHNVQHAPVRHHRTYFRSREKSRCRWVKGMKPTTHTTTTEVTKAVPAAILRMEASRDGR